MGRRGQRWTALDYGDKSLADARKRVRGKPSTPHLSHPTKSQA